MDVDLEYMPMDIGMLISDLQTKFVVGKPHNIKVFGHVCGPMDDEGPPAAKPDAAPNPETSTTSQPLPLGFKVPAEPSQQQRELHDLQTHVCYEPWCPLCVRGKAADDPHRINTISPDDDLGDEQQALPVIQFDIVL